MKKKTEKSEIRKVIDNWTKAVREKNMKGILSNHTKDILMFDVPFPLQAKGIKEYKKTWDLFFKYSPGGEGSFNIVDLKITVGEKVAFAHGLLIIGNGRTPECRLTICLKKVRGKWLITHEHHSAPHKIN